MACMRTASAPCCPGSHSGPLPLGRYHTPADMLRGTNTGVIFILYGGVNYSTMNVIRNHILTHRLEAGHFGGQVLCQPFVFSIQHIVNRTGA